MLAGFTMKTNSTVVDLENMTVFFVIVGGRRAPPTCGQRCNLWPNRYNFEAVQLPMPTNILGFNVRHEGTTFFCAPTHKRRPPPLCAAA